jgi:hypothetical protein
MIRRFLPLLPVLALITLGLRAQQPEDAAPPPPPPLLGQLVNGTYVSPTGVFKVVVPVLPELGGRITDTESVVTFEDEFNVHVSIAAFPQDASQRWEDSTRGTKDYLIYFFTNFVMPDFVQRYEGSKVESARYLPALQDGALLTYTLLPGGSMFVERSTFGDPPDKPVVAKRGNILFVKYGHIFVVSTELAERVLERTTYKKTVAQEDELLRNRLLDLIAKMDFTKPAAEMGKK